MPLAKLSPDDPTTVEVLESHINGQEISPDCADQNDPIQQRALLKHPISGNCFSECIRPRAQQRSKAGDRGYFRARTNFAFLASLRGEIPRAISEPFLL